MRVLILSAFLAVAAAAPSGVLAPIAVPAIRTVAVPAAVPTISPGDIQAAAIDAQVQAQDIAQAAADKARELAEQATENINEKVITDVNVANEQNLEAYWSAEDKKWQTVDALRTAEAKIDGAVASNAEVLAKSAISGAVPYVPAVGPITPIVAPIPPVVYTPYLAHQAYSTQTVIQGQETKSEIKEERKEAAVKTAEPEKPEPTPEAEKTKKVESTESPAVKAAVNLNEKPALTFSQPLIAAPYGLASVYRYDVAVPAAGPVLAQPILNYGASVHGVLTPTFEKTAC